MKIKLTSIILLVLGGFSFIQCDAQPSKDTIRVMVYNTLGFGPGSCQTPTTGLLSTAYTNLKSIIHFANPDIVGLDKLQCVKVNASDPSISPVSFPDTIIAECFGPNFFVCPFTDASGCLDGASSLLFYNHNKLVYKNTTTVYSGQEDFDLYQLYYNEWLNRGADTTYLYVVLCHTISGSASAGRDNQDSTVINKLKGMFSTLPNLIYMGDFNTRSSTEPGYAYITQTDANTNFIMDDPPFHPDAHLTYPDNWNSGNFDEAYFTTTTRISTLPNSCGTTGGAKDWYDHIFLSAPIINGTDNITYIRNSYTTIGNNGNRAGIDINDSTTFGKNLSAPSSVLNAEFNFSDKYPVEVTLAVNPVLAVKNIQSDPGSIKLTNPIINNNLVLHIAPYLNGQNISMDIYDVCGRDIYKSYFMVNNSTINKNIPLAPGVYLFRFTNGGFSTTLKAVKE